MSHVSDKPATCLLDDLDLDTRIYRQMLLVAASRNSSSRSLSGARIGDEPVHAIWVVIGRAADPRAETAPPAPDAGE